MPTPILPNGVVGQRAERAAGVRRLRATLADMRDAYNAWEGLTAAQRNAALKLSLGATIALLAQAAGSIDDRSRPASR